MRMPQTRPKRAPLFVFNQPGGVERCALRRGNVYSADGWRAVLEPVIARYRGTVKRSVFAATRPSPPPRYTSSSKPRASAIRSGFRPTGSCRTRSDICRSARSGDRRSMFAATRLGSAARRRAGTGRAVLWLRSNGMRASFTRASGSSSRPWRGPPSVESLHLPCTYT
jgi:hypothetical protein